MTEPTEPKLDREKARRTVTWGLGLAAVAKLGNVVLSLVLARLLAPEIFGQYGAINSILLIAMAFSMGRYAENMFHSQAPTEQEYFRHLSFGSLLHVVLFAATNLVAVGLRFHETLAPIATPLHVVSFAILLNIPRIYYTVHLRRLLAYKRLRALQIASFVLASCVSLLLAWRGFGVYALLAPNLLVPIPYVASLVISERALLGWDFRWREYAASFRFGTLRTAGVVVENGQALLESLLISTVMGFGALGLFSRARALAQLATSWISDQVVGIMYPALAPLPQRTAEARRIAGLMIRVGLWSSAPVATTIAMNQAASVHLLYGGQWDAVIPVLRPMLLATTASCVFSIVSLVLLTGFGPLRQLGFTIALFGVSAAGIVLALPFGWQVYVLYLAVAYALLMAGSLFYLSQRGLFDLGDILRAFAPALIVAALGVAVSETEAFAAFASAAPNATLFATAAVIPLLFLIMARALDASALSTLCGLLPVAGRFRRLLFLPHPPLKAPA